jgi:preprotein translocase subunit SecD
MTARTKLRLSLVGILIITILAGVVDYPKGPDLHIGSVEKEIKVHLGLDLQGGTSLLYSADVSKIEDADRQTALDSVRDVIEQRINAFGVSEPVIQTIRSGDDWRILVELPGITDINEAVQRIGETPVLEFKTEGEPVAYTDEQVAVIRAQNDSTKSKAQGLLDQLKAGGDFDTLAKENSQDPGSKDAGGDLGEVTKGETVAEFDDVVFNKAEVGTIYPELVETSFGWHIIRVDERTDTSAKVHHILLQKLSETAPTTFALSRRPT